MNAARVRSPRAARMRRRGDPVLVRLALRRSDLYVAIAAIAIFVIFDRAAAWLGSTRGEAGLPVCALVLALVFIAE
jgi:hypothetical protein